MRYAFFGTGKIAGYALEELCDAGQRPDILVTTLDVKKGRGLALEPTVTATLAEEEGIEVWKTEKIDEAFIEKLDERKWDVFVVVDYGQLLPKKALDIPTRGSLNIHPSLLPRLKGPSPIRSAILTDEKNTGVSVMLLDEETDHGPIVAQKKVDVPSWPPKGRELDELLAREGGKLLAQILPLWVRGEIESHPQNHEVETWCKKIEKADAELDLNDDAYKNLLKIKAYDEWPTAFASFERSGKKLRVQILDAHMENGRLAIDIVKPEGKREMSYKEFMASGAHPL